MLTIQQTGNEVNAPWNKGIRGEASCVLYIFPPAFRPDIGEKVPLSRTPGFPVGRGSSQMVVDGIDGGTNGMKSAIPLSGMCKRYAPIFEARLLESMVMEGGRYVMFAIVRRHSSLSPYVQVMLVLLLPAARACLSLPKWRECVEKRERERERQRENFDGKNVRSLALRYTPLADRYSLWKCELRSFRRSCMSYIPSSHIFPLSCIAECARNSARYRAGGKRNANRKFQRIIFPPATSLPRFSARVDSPGNV